jgi:hypothetical protein
MKCAGRVWRNYHSYPCNGRVREGNEYCAMHDPLRKSKRSNAAMVAFHAKTAKRRIELAGPELLEALKRILPHPIFGTTDPKKEREYWEYEDREGRGEAKDVLFALSAIDRAEGK